MVKRLNTIEEVISELGGMKAVAELTNRNTNATVPMWKNRNRFPTATYKTMQKALRQRGVIAPDELWGMQ